MFTKAFEGIIDGLAYTAILFLLMLPLAIWKIIDIIIWLYKHVDINWT